MKSFSFLLSLGVIVLIAVGGYTGYVFWKDGNVSDELQKVNIEITNLQAQILDFEQKGIESTAFARQILDQLKMDAVEWSTVIDAVQRTMPSSRGRAKIDILSYSGAGGQEITMSMRTLAGSSDPYLDVAELIREFDESAQFTDNFVPSIAASTNEEGDEILSFNFGTRFVAAGTESAVPAREVPSPSVSRESSAPVDEAEVTEDIGEILNEAIEDDVATEETTTESEDTQPVAR